MCRTAVTRGRYAAGVEDWVDEAAAALERATGDPMADAWVGTVRVVSATDPAGRGRYQACTVELLLEAPDFPSETMVTEFVFDRRFWPEPGVRVRARFSRRTPREIDANWSSLPRR